MVRLRNAVMTMVLGTGVAGCGFSHSGIAHYSIWHCDECDDFPTPGYGPDFSMMPGTYTGPTPRDSVEPNRPPNSAPPAGSAAPAAQPGASTTQPTTTTPPPPPAAIAPNQGADAALSGSRCAEWARHSGDRLRPCCAAASCRSNGSGRSSGKLTVASSSGRKGAGLDRLREVVGNHSSGLRPTEAASGCPRL